MSFIFLSSSVDITYVRYEKAIVQQNFPDSPNISLQTADPLTNQNEDENLLFNLEIQTK